MKNEPFDIASIPALASLSQRLAGILPAGQSGLPAGVVGGSGETRIVSTDPKSGQTSLRTVRISRSSPEGASGSFASMDPAELQAFADSVMKNAFSSYQAASFAQPKQK